MSTPQQVNKSVGKPISRVDGVEKVTGKAKYAAEFNVPDLAYGVVVSSAIAKGKIKSLDTSDALALDGVLQVFTHENRPKLAWFDISYNDQDAPPGSPFRPLHDATIKYSGQPIALVVAETFEVARYAATLIRADYEEVTHETDLEANLHEARKPKSGIASLLKPPPPKPRGEFDTVYQEDPIKNGGSLRARG